MLEIAFHGSKSPFTFIRNMQMQTDGIRWQWACESPEISRAAVIARRRSSKLRRVELIASLSQAVRQAVWDVEAARQKVQEWEQKQATQALQVQWAEINYRFGEGQTEAMLSHWQILAEGVMQHVWAQEQQEKCRAELLRLVQPIPNTN